MLHREIRAVLTALTAIVLIAMAVPSLAQNGEQSARPTPSQVRDAWQALRQAMVATRNSDNRSQIAVEEAERRFAAHAEAARLLIQSYDEPASGKVLPPGGTITGDALIGGYFPNLARAYCAWMAAQRTQDPARKLSYYSIVYESLWHGADDGSQSGSSKKKSRQLNAIYDSPYVRRMAIAAALARRSLALQIARAAGETDAVGISVAAEMSDLQRLRALPASAFSRVDQQADVEDIIGKAGYLEILGKSVQAVLDAELARAKPTFRLVSERADWQSGGRTKVIAGSIDTLAPVVVRVVDAASGKELPNATQKNVAGPFDIRVDLEERPAPTTVKLVMDDPLSKETIAFDRPIVLWNIPLPTIAVASRLRSITDTQVADLRFTVQRAQPGDVAMIEAIEGNATRKIHELPITDAGDREVVVPNFVVRPNAETIVRLSVRRGASVLVPEDIRVVSHTTPLVSARVLRVNDAVSLIEVDIRDYAERVTRLVINDIAYPDDVGPVTTELGGQEARTRFVYLVPWTRSGETLTIAASTVRDSEPIRLAWPSQMEAADPNDPRIASMARYQQELAKGDLDGAERSYLAVAAQASHAAEARLVLGDLYDLRIRNAPAGASEETSKYLEGLRTLAKAVARDGDLDARIAQIRAQLEAERERQRQAQAEKEAREAAQRAREQQEREEAERRAREAQKAREAAEEAARLQKTPVQIEVKHAAYSAADGILHARLEVTGLVLGRTIRALRIEDTEIPTDLESLVKPDPAQSAASVEFVGVPATTSGSVRVSITVAFPDAGDLPVTKSVELRPGSLDSVSEALSNHVTFLRTGKYGGGAPPAWLTAMARLRAKRLAALATDAVGRVTRDKRENGAVARAREAIRTAVGYAEALKGVTGADEAPEAIAARSALTEALQPKVVTEGIGLVKKGQTFVVADSAAVRVQSWAETLTVKFGDRALTGTRSDGEWRFSLAGLPGQKGTFKVRAEAALDGGEVLVGEQDVTLELPASAVAFNFDKPDFVYCDDGTGRRSLVYGATASGRNGDILIGFDSPAAKLMAWTVVDSAGNTVGGLGREPHVPPLDGLAIPAGKLGIGKYTVKVQLWDSSDASQTPVNQEIPLRIAPPAVAFIVGINYYYEASGQPPLQHAADDAMALRSKLIAKGYAPENIVYVTGRNDTGTPEVRTNGLQNPKSETPNDLSEVRRTGQLNGLARKRYVDTAFEAFLNVVRARQAAHALVFFAGHGSNVAASLEGGRAAFNVDHLIMADDEPSAPAKTYVYHWPNMIKKSVSWGSRESPVTIMCVYDACRNGTRAVFDALPPELRSDDGAVVASALFSCRKGEQANENITSDPKLAIAYDGETFQNGFFTYALLKSLDELPAAGARLPDVIDKAETVLSKLVQQTPEKNRMASGPAKPYSERQSLRPKDDLKRWEEGLYVIYPVERSGVGSGILRVTLARPAR